jgi:hypothetical protein
METSLREYKISGVRVPATDGSDGLESLARLVDKLPDNLSPNELACTISHLRAIKFWLETSKSDTAIICEDDICFSAVKKWNFSWDDVIASLPYYWEILQGCIIYHPQKEKIVTLHHRTSYDFSAAFYVIRRSYALRLMSYYWSPAANKWTLDYKTALKLTSEESIFRPGVCLSMPLFTFTNEHGSDIQSADHLESWHALSKKIHVAIWDQLPSLKNASILQMFPVIKFS